MWIKYAENKSEAITICQIQYTYFEADVLPKASLKIPISVLNLKTFPNAYILKMKMMHTIINKF